MPARPRSERGSTSGRHGDDARHSEATPLLRLDGTSTDSDLLRLLAQNPPRFHNPAFTASPDPIDDPSADLDEISLRITLGHLSNRERASASSARTAVFEDGLAGTGRAGDEGVEMDRSVGEDDESDDEIELDLEFDDDEPEYHSRPGPMRIPVRSQAGLVADEDLRHMLDLGAGRLDSDAPDGPGDGSHSLSTYWPGLVGTHPLNPPSPLRHSVVPAVEDEREPAPTFSRFDPPSATSPTSFLRAGSVLTGQQIFQKRASRPSATVPVAGAYRPPGAATSSLLGFTSPPPLYPAGLPPPSSTHARTPLEDYRAAEARLNSDPLRRARPGTAVAADSNSESESLYSRLLAHPPDDRSPSARARSRGLAEAADGIRARLARLTAEVEGGQYESSAWGMRDEAIAVRERDEQLAGLGRRAALYGNGRAAESTTWGPDEISETPREGISSDEHWAVRVVISSYAPEKRQLSGLMHALGVPDATTQVTTFFDGQILDPAVDGLFTRKWGARRKDDLEYWTRLGPFKGISTDYLATRANDPLWLREQTEGWVLMRWKEEGFVNVTPETSTLSISGFYLIALQRSTGALEGLYCDHGHASGACGSPYQRLILSAATPRAPFALGTFGIL